MEVDFFGEQIQYKQASLGKRFANYLIDQLVMVLLFVIIGIVAGVFIAFSDPDALEMFDEINRVTEWVASIIMGLLYYVGLEATTGRTIGKYITKTKVINENGDTPKFGTVFIRTLCRFIPFEQFSYFGDDQRGWHDSLSKTRVVEIPEQWHENRTTATEERYSA